MSRYTFQDVLEIRNGRNQKKVENPNGKYPIYGSGGIMGYADDYICEANTVIIGRKGSINNPIFVSEPFWNVDTAFGLVANKCMLLPRYLYYFCEFFDFERLNKTVTIPSLTKTDLLKIKINLPDIQTQKQIINKIHNVEIVISLRNQQLKKLDELVKSRFVEMFGDPELNVNNYIISTFGEQFTISSGGTPTTSVDAYWTNGTIPWIGSNLCQNTILYNTDGKCITEEGYSNSSAKWFYSGYVLVALVGATIGKVALLRTNTTTNQNVVGINVNDNKDYVSEYIFYYLHFMYPKFMEIGKSKFKMANQSFIKKLPLLCPPISLQNQFADFVIKVEQQKSTVQKSIDKLETLKKSLMQEYFG